MIVLNILRRNPFFLCEKMSAIIKSGTVEQCVTLRLEDPHFESQCYTRSPFWTQYHSKVHGEQRSNYYKAVMNIKCVGILLPQWSKAGIGRTKKLVMKLSHLKNAEMDTLIFIQMKTQPSSNVLLGSAAKVCMIYYVVYKSC